jgi:hypothetical protein
MPTNDDSDEPVVFRYGDLGLGVALDNAGAAPTAAPRPDVAGTAPAALEEVSAVAGIAPVTGGRTSRLAGTAPAAPEEVSAVAGMAPETGGRMSSLAGMAPAAPEEVSAVAGMAPETGGKTITLAETAPSPRRSEDSSFAMETASAAAGGTTRNMIMGPATGMVTTALARAGARSVGAERAPGPLANASAAAAMARVRYSCQAVARLDTRRRRQRHVCGCEDER